MDNNPNGVPGEKVTDHGSYYELLLEPGTDSNRVLRALAESDGQVGRFEVVSLPLGEIFVRTVRGGS